jgi:predicted RNA-binding protein with PUA domain
MGRKIDAQTSYSVWHGDEVKFEPQEEKWQEYMTTEGFKILVKPIVVKVIKYDKYNNYGEPIYSAIIQAITNIEKLASTATT